MHNSTAKYIQLVKGYKGRVIFANIYLRGNIKLRIIQVYIQAHTLDKESRLDIDQYIYNNLHQAQQNNFKVIIMGDFNVDPDKLDHLILLNKKISWKYKLIQHLRGLNFVPLFMIIKAVPGRTNTLLNA